MLNPFRSEAEAYRFLLLLVGYFAAIVAAKALGGTWAALAAFAVLTVAAIVWLVRAGKSEGPPRETFATHGQEGVRRILVVANETLGGEELRQCIRAKSEGLRAQVFVVTPALNSPLKHWVSDEDDARAAANERLKRSLAELRRYGVDAKGEIGDGEPLQAIEDALRLFGADDIIISTHPEGRSNWLEKGVVDRARERFDAPITHVVVDLEANR